jgi:hypothetical protein
MLPFEPAALAQALYSPTFHAAEFQLQSDHKRNAILRVSLPEPNGIDHDS